MRWPSGWAPVNRSGAGMTVFKSSTISCQNFFLCRTATPPISFILHLSRCRKLKLEIESIFPVDTTVGEIIEIRGANGEPPYVVRFSDGHESLVFPGPDAVIDSSS